MTQVSKFNSQHKYSDHTGSGAYPVSCPAARGQVCPEHKAYQSLSQGVKGKNMWRYISVPPRLHTMMLNPLNAKLNPICHLLAY